MTQPDLFQNDQISSRQVIRVNHSQRVVKGEAQKTLATSFRTCINLLNKSDPLIVFSKMFMDTSHWDLTRYSLQWKASTTTRGHLYFRLVQSELDTNEKDYGSSVETWATPTTMDSLPPRSAKATKKMQEGHRKGRKRPSNLREQVDPKTMEMYPTPTTKGFGHASEGQTMMFRRKVEKGELTEAEAQAMMNGVTLRPPRMEEWNYPTPTSSLKKHSYNGNKDFWENRVEKGRQMDLGMKMYQTEGDGRLNCDWTEWLMGYPIGWTNLEESQE